MGLITENNRQYYEGAQGFIGDDEQNIFTTTFNTNLVFRTWDPSDEYYPLNNFKLYISEDGQPGTFEEYINPYSVVGNSIVFSGPIALGDYIVVQLKSLSGGNYGQAGDPDSFAYGNTVEENYGSYAYISLDDLINNFIIAYVGTDKLIPSAKRTDIIFHAKRGMQEFSYDTLRSIKSQELTVPHNLSVVLPQDYVNYVKISRIDHHGIKHPLYPTNNLTVSTYENPIQDTEGVPTQDNFNNNIEGTSITEERWKKNNSRQLFFDSGSFIGDWYNGDIWLRDAVYGRRYGADPQYANINGYFTMNDRENKISFSSDLIDKLIVLEYISDGLAYDLDTKVPKMAEEAMYAHILHAIISTRRDQPEYLVQRLKQERFAKLRNAKIRLSNIKLEEITQVLRGKSKWIKH